MLKKIITYTDFNGVERKEEHYFNLTETELAKLETSEAGGFSGLLKRIVEAQDIPSITKVVNDIIAMSYGIKSPDGRRFIKSKEITEEFMQTGAYDVLYMELFSDDGTAAANFINAIIPEKLRTQLKEIK